jgi:hypothetical protein
VKKLVMCAAVTVLAIVAAGCGGGGGGSALSKDEYSARLNHICEELNAKNKEIGDPGSVEDVVQKGPKLNDAFQEAIDEVEDLNPPDELKDAHERFLSLGKQIHSKIDNLIDAAKENNQAELQEIGTSIDPLDKESNDIATKQLGAPACAQG